MATAVLVSTLIAELSATVLSSAPVAFNPVTFLLSSTYVLIALADASVSSLPDTELMSVSIDDIPSNTFSSAAVDVTFVPPMSSVVTDISPATVTRPLATVIKSVSSVCPMVEPLINTSSISSEPPVIRPVVVIAEEPVSIVPKPEVILPEFNAPTVVTFDSVSNADSKYVSKSVSATCTIVPLSFTTTLSASASVVEVAEVSPSTIFISAAVDVTPSNMFSSAVVDVTPSNKFNSAGVDVIAVSLSAANTGSVPD